jgi:hypothetical protein
MSSSTAFSQAWGQGMEKTNIETPKREWAFIAILATLIAGSLMSFAFAWTARPVAHLELKTAADHSQIKPQLMRPRSEERGE